METKMEVRQPRIAWWNPGYHYDYQNDSRVAEPGRTYTWEFIKPAMMRWNDITEAQIFLTRKCNLACGYCKLVENQSLEELDYREWVEAAKNMSKIGIKTVKILGGEPTVKEWLPDFIETLENEGIRTALLSNSSFDREMCSRLVAKGLYGYFASVDGLQEIDQYDGYTSKKSHSGYAMLRRLKRKGVPLLAANAVIHRQNIDEIPELVQRLSDEGFYINLCTIQHTSDQRREFSRASTQIEGLQKRFTDEDRPRLKELARQLAAMQASGVKISIPASYLENMAEYAPGCSWQCDRLYQLRIDADGGLMLCNEYRSDLAERFNITTMDRFAWADFQNEWVEERKSLDCHGCYWSCFLQAKDNVEKKSLEFGYAAGAEGILA